MDSKKGARGMFDEDDYLVHAVMDDDMDLLCLFTASDAPVPIINVFASADAKPNPPLALEFGAAESPPKQLDEVAPAYLKSQGGGTIVRRRRRRVWNGNGGNYSSVAAEADESGHRVDDAGFSGCFPRKTRKAKSPRKRAAATARGERSSANIFSLKDARTRGDAANTHVLLYPQVDPTPSLPPILVSDGREHVEEIPASIQKAYDEDATSTCSPPTKARGTASSTVPGKALHGIAIQCLEASRQPVVPPPIVLDIDGDASVPGMGKDRNTPQRHNKWEWMEAELSTALDDDAGHDMPSRFRMSDFSGDNLSPMSRV